MEHDACADDACDDDAWISAWHVLRPVSPTGLDARDAFDAELFAQDSYLHDQWQRTLEAEAPPWRFEAAPRELAAPVPMPAPAPPPPPMPALAPPLPPMPAPPPAPPPAGERRLTDDERPFDKATEFTVFVKDMLRARNNMFLPPVYYSLGEVAQYFNHFTVDVLCHGPYTCRQIAFNRRVPEEHLHSLWTFRPGPKPFTKRQVAAKLGMSVLQVERAYAALGFSAWVL